MFEAEIVPKPSDTNGCSDSNLKQNKNKITLDLVISIVVAILTKMCNWEE